jgi:anti-sigma-K factor RskA
MNEYEHAHPTRPDGCEGDAPAYVLGALTEAERVAFEAHMASCALCREELTSLRDAASALPLAAPQMSAPEGLRARVLAQVRAEPRHRAAATPQRSRGGASAARRRPLLRGYAIVPAAGAIAVVALVLAIVLSGGGGSPATRVFKAEVRAAGASGYVSVSGSHAQLTLTGMPATAPGRVYELWIKRSGAPAPTDALFSVTRAGTATVGVPGSVAGVRALMVTSEPLGGSRAPTREPVVIASIG